MSFKYVDAVGNEILIKMSEIMILNAMVKLHQSRLLLRDTIIIIASERQEFTKKVNRIQLNVQTIPLHNWLKA